MIGKKLEEVADSTVIENRRRWEQRLNYEEISSQKSQNPKSNPLKAMPNLWCKIINTQHKPCPKCKKNGVVMDAFHINQVHGIKIQHINEIWEEHISPLMKRKKLTLKRNGKEEWILLSRKEISQELKPLLERMINDYEMALARIVNEG